MSTETITAGHRLLREVEESVHRRVVGQDETIQGLLIAILTGGHVLLEGLPGLAKTLLVRSLADALHTTFRRIQFTPDLLPGDVVGLPVYPLCGVCALRSLCPRIGVEREGRVPAARRS